MHTHHLDDKFEFTSKLKTWCFILMGVGLVALSLLIMGSMSHGDEHHHHTAVNRLWSNILIDGFFFFSIAIGATFFMAVQYAAETGWSIILKRIMEAVSSYLIVGIIPLILVFIAGFMHWHHIYHWMDPAVTTVGSPEFDPIIAHKKPFLNVGVFSGLTVLFLSVYVYFQRKFRNRSLEEDQTGGVAVHKKNFTAAAIFLVFFGYTSMVASWMWIMSIDTHWFSTLFGWYVFSGMWISALITITLTTLWLKSRGHLSYVNSSHIHDMGKWMFAISFLWSYLWFSQFMLIWYANIPEESAYYIPRVFGEYKYLYLGMFFVNFILPMLFLMDKSNKSNPAFLSIIGIIIFMGHWVDVYLLITPAVLKNHFHIGFEEIGLMLGFLGMFLYIMLGALSRANLVVKHNPYLEESLHFHQ